jgi:hypothetical protein
MTEKKEAPLTPTSAADWPSKKASEGVVVELPSGCVARLRRPPLQYLIATGRIPPKLWAKVQKEGAELFADPVNTMSKEELSLFIDWMIAAAFMEPEVAMARKDGTLYIGDLSEDDKGEVMDLLGLSLAG